MRSSYFFDSPNFYNETKRLLILVIPIALTGLLESSAGFINTVMLAHLGNDKLAAGGLVTVLFSTLMTVFYGVISATSTVIAHHEGAEKKNLIGEVTRSSLILAFILSIPVMILLWNADNILIYLGQEEKTVELAQDYLHGLTWAVLPDLLTIVLFNFFLGVFRPNITLLLSLFYVPLNIIANYVLMFGKFGFPALGIAGIGWGTTFAFTIVFLLTINYIFLHKEFRVYFKRHITPRASHFLEIINLGLPIGAMWGLEWGIFLVVALFMGYIGPQTLAAHQIAMQCLFLVFTVVSGIAQATSIRVGRAIGQNNIQKAVQNSYASVLLSGIYMSLIGILYWTIPEKIIAIDLNLQSSSNQNVIQIATQFLFVAAIFQIFDGMRFALFGALRGMKDTRFTMLVSFVTFWLISLPVGYLMVFYFNWCGAVGLWWALCLGALLGLVLLLGRFSYLTKTLKTKQLENL